MGGETCTEGQRIGGGGGERERERERERVRIQAAITPTKASNPVKRREAFSAGIELSVAVRSGGSTYLGLSSRPGSLSGAKQARGTKYSLTGTHAARTFSRS